MGTNRTHRLGKYFVLPEFSDHDVGQLPPRESVHALGHLCKSYLDPLRIEFGTVLITSGYRTDATNRNVGGAAQSRHMYHRFPGSPACDLVARRGTPAGWYEFLDALNVGGLGLYRGHVHVDLRKYRARWTDL